MAGSPAPSAYDWRAWMPADRVVAPTASGRTAAREGVPHLVTTSREAERVHLLAYLADLLNDRAQVEKSVHSALAAGRDASGERHSLENINRRIELAREAIERINDAVEERDQPIEADEYGIEEREDTPTGEGLREPSRHSSYPRNPIAVAGSAMSTSTRREPAVIADSRAAMTSPQASSSTAHGASASTSNVPRPWTSAMPPPPATGAVSGQCSLGVGPVRYGAAPTLPASYPRSQPLAAGPSRLGASTSQAAQATQATQAAQAVPTWTVATPQWTTSGSESEQIDELQSDSQSVAPGGPSGNVGGGSRW